MNFIRSPSTPSLVFRTSRRVEEGEELCICYSADENKLWFTPARATSLVNGNENGNRVASGSEEELIFPTIEPEDLILPFKKEQAGGDVSEPHIAGQERQATYAADIPAVPDQPLLSDDPLILFPRPIPFTGSVLPDLAYQPRPDLPTPLHSGPNKVERHEHVGPVVLNPPLDWREEDWFDKGKEREVTLNESWGEVERIKGPAERQDEAGVDQAMCKPTHSVQGHSTDESVDVWVVGVTEPRLTREVLRYGRSGFVVVF